jgi:ATP-dependent DNA helicase RecG
MVELLMDSRIQYIKGVGPQRAKALSTVGIETVYDLLNYLPRKYIDRSMIVPIGSLKANMRVTVIGKVMGKGILKGRRSRLEVVIGDETGHIALIWFAGHRYLERLFNKGDIYSATGEVTYYQQRQMVHPEVERIESETAQLIHMGRIVPVYPSTAELKNTGVSGRIFRQIITRALEAVGGRIKDFIPSRYTRRYDLMPLDRAISLIHYPGKLSDIEAARRRLAFDELLGLQYMVLSSRKETNKIVKRHRYQKPDQQMQAFYKSLPFKLTVDQRNAIKRILADMRSDRPMHRLLQGDVGCGKTVVALFAIVYAAENSLQSAFMAPTELLAEQHYDNWKEVLAGMGINSALLTGSLTRQDRRRVDKDIEGGQVRVVFGTHAVISEAVTFSRLGLVVIDEQHRFGVLQRGRLLGKGLYPDMLVMSATPIPRTLALTLYGDLDITSIRTMPPGRRPPKTIWRPASSRPEIYSYLKKKIAEGEQAFFVYPLVEKSEKMDLQAAEEEYQRLKKEVFPEYKVGIVHGRMKRQDREKPVAAFRQGIMNIMVATTVIEVGLDIPAASIMVIEHGERFGLAQLHQLRGRVGRGERRGMVIVIASPPLSDLARQRLDMFQSITDGFKIAEADLKLRGPGEFFGTRQHGLPELRIADLSTDAELLPPARELVVNLLGDENSLDNEDQALLTYLGKEARSGKALARIG